MAYSLRFKLDSRNTPIGSDSNDLPGVHIRNECVIQTNPFPRLAFYSERKVGWKLTLVRQTL